jgi:hypothetical protein
MSSKYRYIMGGERGDIVLNIGILWEGKGGDIVFRPIYRPLLSPGPRVVCRNGGETPAVKMCLAAVTAASATPYPEPLHNRLLDMEAQVFRENCPLPSDLYCRYS